MALLNIQNTPIDRPFSIFVLGFRPFFLVAGLFAVISMAAWMAVYNFGFTLPLNELPPFYWHAHEMIFGFALAVVSGFLLTAIKNWTGVQTLQYRGLMLLTLLWAGARIGFLLGSDLIIITAVLDLAFNLLLIVFLTLPILQVKQWKQLGILSKIALLGLCNGLFYLGWAGWLDSGVYWGVNGALFLLLALAMTMGRRVMPMFFQNGVNYPVKLKNSRFLDISSLVLFLGLALSEVVLLDSTLSSYFSAPLVVVSIMRLLNWHTSGIWRSPLLWGLYVAFIFFTLGFLLFALLPYTPLITRSLALHAFTVGGIGLITLSMMSRVTLGHTGRDILQPPPGSGVAHGLILTGAIIRTLATIVWPEYYPQWILFSQMLWIVGFALFVVIYYPALTRARIDGRQG